MLYHITNCITKRNKPVELVWCEVILDKRKRHQKFYITLTEPNYLSAHEKITTQN